MEYSMDEDECSGKLHLKGINWIKYMFPLYHLLNNKISRNTISLLTVKLIKYIYSSIHSKLEGLVGDSIKIQRYSKNIIAANCLWCTMGGRKKKRDDEDTLPIITVDGLASLFLLLH